MIYHMQDDKNESLDHITKKNHSKIQSILFLSKLLTDAETWYWSTELKITCVIWTVKKICHIISEFLIETVIWTDYSVILQILKQIMFSSLFIDKLNLCLIWVSQYCSQFEIDIQHQSDWLNKVSDALSQLLNQIAEFWLSTQDDMLDEIFIYNTIMIKMSLKFLLLIHTEKILQSVVTAK